MSPAEERPDHPEQLDEAVRLRRERRERWRHEGERSIGQNLAMIGALGWTIVTPTVIGIFAGRWLDGAFGSGIFWTLGLLVAGLALGCSLGVEADASGMTGLSLAAAVAIGSGAAVAGLLLGCVQFAALRRTVELYRAGRYLAPSALTLSRLAGAIVFFVLVARLGALPLLSAFLGFLLARRLALRAARSPA